ncbi:hypothetical protein A9Q74_05910 [Colwellia sp. 39_35_sub15_T18]|nr:hypothetical protein A9Q74_05910 [Colwellia sp. 39_35_sub15_T18]
MQQINPAPVTMPIPANASVANAPMTSAPMTNTIELNDIHIPAQVSNYPIAYGWWLLAVMTLIVIVFLFIKSRQKAKLKRHQQQAIKQLKNSPSMSNSDVIALLKWAAIHYFSRVQLAKLFSEQFQQFLIEKLTEKHQKEFKQLSTQAFSEQYQAQTNKSSQTELSAKTNQELHQAAMLWLTHALPPKPSKPKEVIVSTAKEQQGANR